MHIHYQLTYADFSEFMRSRSRLRLGFVAFWIGVAMLLPLIAQAVWPEVPTVYGPAVRSSPVAFLIDSVAWVVMFALNLILYLRVIRGLTSKPWLREPTAPSVIPRAAQGVLGMALLLAIAATFGWAVRSRRALADALGPRVDPGWSPLVDTALLVMPWLVSMALMVLLMRITTLSTRKSWEAQPHIHRPFEAQIGEQSLQTSEPLSLHTHQWDYFRGWVETANEFVLYYSTVSAELIPKRAFADEAARAWFRDLLARRIREQVNAFPVALPLPELPAAVG